MSYVPPHLRAARAAAAAAAVAQPPPSSTSRDEPQPPTDGEAAQPRAGRAQPPSGHGPAHAANGTRSTSSSQDWRVARQQQPPPPAALPPSGPHAVAADGSFFSLESERDSVEARTLQDYYTEHSAGFRDWRDTRNRGYDNPHVTAFFDGKERGRDNGVRTQAKVAKPLFNRFLRYACDIDNGVHFAAKAAAIASERGSCWFLDFGFAPGGMSEMLLAAHPAIQGVGVTLDPAEGGNAFPDDFAEGKGGRFRCVVGDVIRMAREGPSVVEAARLPPDFPGFDLVIIGITIHQKADGERYNELKDLLHLCQLALTWPCIRPGGCALMRMHMSLRLIDLHFLTWMLAHFRGAAADAGADADAPGAGLVAATKPMSEFAMRKTYWVLYEGFSAAAAEAHGSAARLARAVAPRERPGGAYGYDGEAGRYADPALMDDGVDALLARYGATLVALLEPMWRSQVVALEGFMAGLRDRFCPAHAACRRRFRQPDGCGGAHSLDEMIPAVLAAARAVEVTARPFLREDEADARAPYLLEQAAASGF